MVKDKKISDIIDLRCIQLELNASKKEEAIEELVWLFTSAGKLDGVERYVNEIMAREKISSTGIGQGIAIPHRLIAGVDEIMIAVGRKAKGVSFNSIDGKPAHLIFMIIGPQGRNNEYLQILSKLSRHLNDRDFFGTLMKVKNAEEVIELFKEREG